MMGLRVLLTNNALAERAGSEVFVLEVATALLARGHTPVVYSTELGETARALRAATVPVVDDLALVSEPPDVIHGQHHIETMTALLHFPATPALFVCHGWRPWQEAPPRFPRVHRWVAVDEPCRDRLVYEHGVPPDRVRLVPNFVDLDRFRPRAPLPERPRRALAFGNAMAPERLPVLHEACARAGVALEFRGSANGNPTAAPETLLEGYDLVFAKARCALEALAVGAAVVLCDPPRMGPLVTRATVERLRALNFGVRALDRDAGADALVAEVARYDAADAAAVSAWVRAHAGRDAAVDRLVALYDEVIAAHRASPPDPAAEQAAAAAYLRSLRRALGPPLRERADLMGHCHRLDTALRAARAEGEALAAERDRVAAARAGLAAERDRIARALDESTAARAGEAALREQLAAERDALGDRLAAATGSATYRLREWVLGSRILGTPARLLARAARGRLYR
jgi:Glycosyltransferase Family 4